MAVTYAAPATDPAYAAIAASLQAQRQQYLSANQLQKGNLNNAYQFALGRFNDTVPGMQRRLDAGLEARGVASSSEANRRRLDQTKQVALQRSDMANTRQRGYLTADQSLAGQLADLAARQQQAIADSQQRALERQRVDEQRAQQLAVAGLKPGIDFAALARMSQPKPAAPALRPGIDFAALARMSGGK